MTIWQRWMFALLAVVAFGLLAACGDDDDEDDGGNDTPPASETVSEGDDAEDEATNTPEQDNDEDEDEDSDPIGAIGGDEEEYVTKVCTAMNDLLNDFSELIANPENQDLTDEEGLALFEEPFERVLEALRDADPPGDFEEYHEATVDSIEQGLEAIRAGDLTAFEELDVEVPEPPAEIQQKYGAIAAGIPECEAAGVFDQGTP